jgi:cell cycle related kinase
MMELPDYKKISFPFMPPIPLDVVLPDASPEVMEWSLMMGVVIT